MRDSSQESHLLGVWARDDLATTARANMGIGADSDLPEAVRFLSGVVKLIRRRMAVSGANDDPERPAIFLLEPNARSHKADVNPTRVPMLDNGLTVVTGRLWFVSQIVRSGKYVDLEDEDDDALFRVVTNTLGVGGVPAIIYDPRTKPATVRYFPNGLTDAETCDPISVKSDVSLQYIHLVIDKIHHDCLVTPEAQSRAGKLWQNGERWWPSSDAEDVVQLYLRAGLTTAFPACTVRHEQTTVPGRLDLIIEESHALDRSQVTRHAVLELKVLRSFNMRGRPVSGGETEDWIKSGVVQAAAYRQEIGALAASLCCFDMRREHSGDRCFDHVRILASNLSVELKHWFIFATSAQYRQFMTTGR